MQHAKIRPVDKNYSSSKSSNLQLVLVSLGSKLFDLVSLESKLFDQYL